MKHCASGLIAAALLLVLGGCAALSYEAEEWRIVRGEGEAYAVVRYTGVGATGAGADAQRAAVEQLEELAADTSPSAPYTSMLHDARRRVYVEGDRVVLEEAGKIRDPLSWFEQTGLNPLAWIEGSPRLTSRGNYVVKRGLTQETTILASNGQVVDEDTYERLASQPVNLASDRTWLVEDNARFEEYTPADYLEMIVWPLETKTFYWKLSGPAYGAVDRSIAAELLQDEPGTVQLPAPEPGAQPVFRTDEPEDTGADIEVESDARAATEATDAGAAVEEQETME